MKTYAEMIKFSTFVERYNYLRTNGEIGIQTFGHGRFLNQSFYSSREWKLMRHRIIERDNGCDLGLPDHPIYKQIYIHHMNPISSKDFEEERFSKILDPEYLVCVSFDTHNALHYGTIKNLPLPLVLERKKGDTTPWEVS